MSVVGRSWAALLLVASLSTIPLSGCLSFGSNPPPSNRLPAIDLVAETVEKGLAKLAGLREPPKLIEVDVTIHIVFVGLDPSLVDSEGIRAALPKDYSPWVPFSRLPAPQLRSGLVQNLAYEFHTAPEAFARDLFAYYPEVSREVDLPRMAGQPTSFLERYDAMYDLGRARTGKVHLVDAEKVESWMENHRDEHGLRFAKPSYTILFLDSYTTHGLWKNEYYWYEYARESRLNPDAANMRAWGGTFDFVFMDYSAAPNDAFFDNTGIVSANPFGPGVTPVPVPAPEGTAYNDPPMWHYRGSTATIGKGPLEKKVTLTDRIRHAVDVAVNIRIIGDYNGPPVYSERYHINVHLWHDGRSMIPVENLDKFLTLETLLEGLQDEVPWAQVTGSLKTYVAPRDDPGMDEALTRAKADAAGTYVATAPISNYVDAHLEKYARHEPGTLDVMALLFLFEGHYTLVLPLIVGGVSLTSPDGTNWGTMSSLNDLAYVGSGRNMSRLAEDLIGINAHEIGHYFGLYHAHDGYRHGTNGYEPVGDHTWSTTNTVMSYRLRPPTSDLFHLELIARAHALQNLEETLRNAHSTYRALNAAGVDTPPPEIANLLATATEAYDRAHQQFEQGEFLGAVRTSIEGRRATDTAMTLSGVGERQDLVAKWTTTGVQSAGVKHSVIVMRPGVAPAGIKFDYRPIKVHEDVERITVRVAWTNGPVSWGDFFAGWHVEGIPGFISVGVREVENLVGLMGGIHDTSDEGPLHGAATEAFTLDLDAFPNFRQGRTIQMGAGTQGMAANGAYTVEVLFTLRDHGERPPGSS